MLGNDLERIKRLLEQKKEISVARILDGESVFGTLLDRNFPPGFFGSSTYEEQQREIKKRLNIVLLILEYATKHLSKSKLKKFVNTPNKYGFTPLQEIILVNGDWYGSFPSSNTIPFNLRYDVMKALIDAGADVNVENKNERSYTRPLDLFMFQRERDPNSQTLSLFNQYSKIIVLLQRAGATLTPALREIRIRNKQPYI